MDQNKSLPPQTPPAAPQEQNNPTNTPSQPIPPQTPLTPFPTEPTPPQQPTGSVNPPMQTPSKKSSGAIIVVIIASLITLGLAASYFLLGSNNKAPKSMPKVEVTATQTPATPTPQSLEDEVNQVKVDDDTTDFNAIEKDINAL